MEGAQHKFKLRVRYETCAEPDPSWKCTGCGAAWLHWSPVCGKCESLGTLDWGTPERARDDTIATTIIAPDPALTDQSAEGGGDGEDRSRDEDGGDGDASVEGVGGVEGDESFFPDAEESTPSRRLPVFGGRRLTLS